MKSRTVLIAYQDDLGAKPLSTFFQNAGFRVETPRGLSELIRKMQNGNTPVVLLDDEVEGIKAYDLVHLLKRVKPRTPIIVITSEGSIGLAKRLRGAGVFYQAMKPMDFEEIKGAVECAFEKIERERTHEGLLPVLIPRRGLA